MLFLKLYFILNIKNNTEELIAIEKITCKKYNDYNTLKLRGK